MPMSLNLLLQLPNHHHLEQPNHRLHRHRDRSLVHNLQPCGNTSPSSCFPNQTSIIHLFPIFSPVSVAPRPPSVDSDVTQYKFVDDSNAIELEIEELTAKAVVLEESLDMIEADWKGKPMDKATLDVVTTLGLERGDIMRKLESLQKQKRLMELERDRRNRTRIINKTLKAVTTRPSEAPDSPAPLPNSSVSNSDDLEADTGAGTIVHRVSSSHSSTLANDTTDSAVDSEDAPVRTNSNDNGNGSRVRHRTKVSRRRDAAGAPTAAVVQEDESMAASEDSSNSQVVVKHRVRRPSNRTLSSPVALAVTAEEAKGAMQPLKKESGSGERERNGSGSGLTSSSGGSIVERLRAAALAKEQEKKRLMEQQEK